MAEIYLVKRYGQLMPANESDAEKINLLPDGGTFKASLTKPRNGGFHRKYFALLEVMFELWNPELPEWNGKPSMKSFERFRKDIAIATGHFELVVSIKGEVRAEAKSISFANMDELQFAALYSMTISYAIQKICTDKTAEELDAWVQQIMDFS
jgi:hypothetical protein